MMRELGPFCRGALSARCIQPLCGGKACHSGPEILHSCCRSLASGGKWGDVTF